MASCLSRLQTELQSFMQLLLKSIVYEVAGVFGNRTSDSEDEVQDQLRNIAQILVRRAVFKITQCVEETFGSEMAQMKKENETLKVRLRFWEKESRAGGDRGQTDRDGHTLPCEVTAEIKEETDTEPELSGSEASALPDAGDRAPLEQQPSEEEEEEWGSRLMQETELAAAHGKETLGEQQHTESRQRVEDLDSVSVMKTEPECETAGVSVTEDLTERIHNQDTWSIPQSCNGLDCVSLQEHKEELADLSLADQDGVSQLIDPAEQRRDVPAGENSAGLRHPEKGQDREELGRETTLSEQTGGGDPDSGRHPRRGAALEHIQGHPVLAGILDPEEFDTRSAGSRSLSAVSLQEQTGYYRLKRRKVELGIELLETQLDASVDIAPR
ncbi:uncharacterized protein [Lepisosteus oculatus]|uniref:uncharacterized protein isoform X1 n=1 Tax=Lepisosteus oculatus TaxID=7918 RepID=UPI0035F51BDD